MSTKDKDDQDAEALKLIEAIPNVEPEEVFIEHVENHPCDSLEEGRSLTVGQAEAAYAQQIQSLRNELEKATQQLQVVRSDCERFQKEKEYYKREASKLHGSIAQRDQQLNAFYNLQLRQLAVEKDTMSFRYESEINSLRHKLHSRNIETQQYIDQITAENQQLRLRLQQSESQHQENICYSGPTNLGFTPGRSNNESPVPNKFIPTSIFTNEVALPPPPQPSISRLSYNEPSLRSIHDCLQPWTQAADEQRNSISAHQQSRARAPERLSYSSREPIHTFSNSNTLCTSVTHFTASQHVHQQRQVVSVGNYELQPISYIRTTEATALSLSHYPHTPSRIRNDPELSVADGRLQPHRILEDEQSDSPSTNQRPPILGKHMMPLQTSTPPVKRMKSMSACSPVAGSEATNDSGLASPSLAMTPNYSYSLAGTPHSSFLGTPLTLDLFFETDEVDVQINEIAREIGIYPGSLDAKNCSEDHLLAIAKLLEHPSSYATHLDVTESELQSIQSNRELTAAHDKPLKILKLWQKKNAYTDKGSYRHLLRGVINIHTDRKLVGEICKLLK